MNFYSDFLKANSTICNQVRVVHCVLTYVHVLQTDQ